MMGGIVTEHTQTMKLNFTSQTPQDTDTLAALLAKTLPPGAIVRLHGDLGAGKTAFSRAVLRTLSQKPDLEVPSPTFNLVHTYDTPQGALWHFDLYRIKDPEEIDELGWEEALAAPLVLIEWPDRLGSRPLPAGRVVDITLKEQIGKPEARDITLEIAARQAPQTAFIFAAGLGERMRPLTDSMPKPLVPVAGRPILAYIFDRLKAAKIKNAVLNTHWFPEQIEHFLDPYRGEMNIRTSFESQLLETGGGLKKALPLIADDVFYVINGDALWVDGLVLPALERLALAFDPARMDALLLLQPIGGMTVTPGAGDYRRAPDGRLTRTPDKSGELMFTGLRIMHRRMLGSATETPHSFREELDESQQKGRLYGLIHDGEWHHISTPEDAQATGAHLLKTEKENG